MVSLGRGKVLKKDFYTGVQFNKGERKHLVYVKNATL